MFVNKVGKLKSAKKERLKRKGKENQIISKLLNCRIL
jgi:hypothetical protein